MPQINQAYEIVNELTWKRVHQTMIVILVEEEPSEKFLERSNRFITSLNRSDTIKADIFLVINGCFIHVKDGDNWRQYSDTINVSSKKTISNNFVKEFAEACGYVQFAILESANI